VTRRTIIEATGERDILSWMIGSDAVYRHAVTKWDPARLFESSFSRTVAGWIQEWAKVESAKAPGQAMSMIYTTHMGEVSDETTSRAVAEFLANLSRDWSVAEPVSEAFAKDQADLYFRRRTITRALDMAQRSLESGTADGLAQAENAFLSFSKPSATEAPIVDLLHDAATIQEAYTTEDEEIFRMPGCVGQLLGPIIRGDFVGILAPQKRGKSFWVDLFTMAETLESRKNALRVVVDGKTETNEDESIVAMVRNLQKEGSR